MEIEIRSLINAMDSVGGLATPMSATLEKSSDFQVS